MLQPSAQRLTNVTTSTQLHLGKASELALLSTSAAPAGRVSGGARQIFLGTTNRANEHELASFFFISQSELKELIFSD